MSEKIFKKPRGIKIEHDAWYKISTVAKYLDIHPETLRRLIFQDKFNRVIKVGQTLKIRGSAILEYEHEQAV